MAISDMQKILNLVPTNQATCVAVQTGNWSDPNSWAGGVLPATDGFVWIPAGITISQDIDSPKLKKLFVQGSFGPLQGATCKLWVDLFASDMGSTIFAGDANNPFNGQWTVLFADYGPINLVDDPWVMGRGMQCMGNLALYGSDYDAFVFTNGNVVGDTVILLQSPCNGWKVGDKLVLPGTGFGTIDDDECIIQSISPDLLSITVTAPLKYAHGIYDREGGLRPMFVANISPRSIHFDSENSTVVAQRGHLMMMRSDNMTSHVMKNVSVFNCGRTDKSKPVSDPDGLGGGTSNPRGRYSVHFHKCNPDITGMEAMLSGICVVGSPGWGIVNHDSYVDCDSSVVYKVYGAHYAGEIGTETGCFCNCVAIRSTSPFSKADQFSDPAASPGPLADWGKLGHGFWDMCGAIQLLDCIATGISDDAFVHMGIPFQLTTSSPQVMFNTANLPFGYTYNKTTCLAAYVPRQDSGLRCFGCCKMLLPWNLNINGGGVPIGRSVFSDIRGEVSQRLIMRGYLSGLDLTNIYGVRIGSDYINSTGIIHSGTNSNCTIDNTALYGFDVGIMAGNVNDHTMSNITHRCLTGIMVNPPPNGSRTMTINNVTMLPLSTTDMNYVLSKFNIYTHQVFGVIGPKTQTNIACVMTQQGTVLYAKTPTNGTNFPQFTQNFYAVCANDTVTYNGTYLYYIEESPDWKLSNVPNVPALVKNLTNAQMWSQYGITMGARLLPADAVLSPNNLAMQSNSFATTLPDVQVDKWHASRSGLNYQQANVTTGFTIKVKDNNGNFVYAGPFNLTDKAWNIVPVGIYGTVRGVFVYCDTASTPVVVW